MTRWARTGSTQRHRKPPQDPTPWEEFAAASHAKSGIRRKAKHGTAIEVSTKHGKESTGVEGGLSVPTDTDSAAKKKNLSEDQAFMSQSSEDLNFVSRKVRKNKREKKGKHLSFHDQPDADMGSGVEESTLFNFQGRNKGLENASEEELEKRKRKKKAHMFEDDLTEKAVKMVKKKRKKAQVLEGTLLEEMVGVKKIKKAQTLEDALVEEARKLKKKKKKGAIKSEDQLGSDQEKLSSLQQFTEDAAISDEVSSKKGASQQSSTHTNDSKKVGKKGKGKKQFLEKLREKRIQKGILLLPEKVERKLYLLKKALRNKGLPGNSIKQIVRQARRKEELKFRKTLNVKTCFNCRKVGHILSACPELQGDVEQGTGICFKCGSTEHTSHNCHIKGSDFPFAKCFICHEQGHLSRNCPKNEHGAYPKGGKCNLCGEVDHLKKDCPKLRKKSSEEELTASVVTSGTSVDEEVIEKKGSNFGTVKKTKVVKF